jgi:RHS repeat-associated protein
MRPGGGAHQFGYDSLGRRISRSERVSGVWLTASYAYDAGGNLLAVELPNGMRQELEYDVYGRTTRHRALRGGSVEGERLLTYHQGQLETSWDSVRGTTEVHRYDAAGRPTSVQFGNGDTLTRSFDERSRVVSEAWAFASEVLAEVGYAYDLANRLTLVSEGPTNERVLSIEYAAGRPVAIRYSNGLTRRILFDPITGQLEGAELRDEQGSLVAETTVTRTTESDPVRSQVNVAVQTSLAATEERYGLSSSSRLTDPGSRLLHWENDEGTALAFRYDALGNRVGTGQDSFTYNAERNRVEAVSLGGDSIDYTYDDAGYVTSRAGVPISWSAAGRMTSFGDDRAVWDMSGRLVELEVGGQVRRFDLFGGRIESDLTDGTIGRLDLHHATIDLGTGERRFRHFDFRNNVSYVTDASANVLAHYRYRPYGLDRVFGVHQGADFVGKASFGSLMMLGARVYDPEVGRFLSQDPLLQVANQYAYTSGNPVWFMDASGRVESETMVKVFGAVVAAALFVATLPASGTISIAGVTVAQIATGAAVSGAVAAAASGVGELVADGLGLRGGPSSGGDGPSDPRFDPAPGGTEGIPDYVLTLELSHVDPEPPPSCSPRRLSETPNGARWLPWLVAMNVLLGWLLLRSRRSGGRLYEGPRREAGRVGAGSSGSRRSRTESDDPFAGGR